MAPHAEEILPDTGVDLIQPGDRIYGDWRDDFHRDGCAVIKNVVSPERAEYYKKKQIEWLQSFNLGFDPNDKSTWTKDHLPVSFKGGMYFGYGSNHEKFVWEARTEPKIIEAFEKLWETDELLVSFDGQNITLPQQKDLTWTPWPHCDQSQLRKGMQCVQGLVNYQPNGENDGGLVLVKGSAKLFDEFFKEERIGAQAADAPPPELKMIDHFRFTDEQVKWFLDRGCTIQKMNLDPGDLVLWDSRTMHWAVFPEGERIRHVQYLCYTPAKFAAKEDLELKADLFKKWEGTTHWPHRNIHKSFPPKRNGEICPYIRYEPYEKPEITDQVLKLAGVKAY